MAAELFAGLGAFKTMLDIAKGLKDINDAATRNAAVIELQEQILTAQAEQTALIQKVGELEKQVADFETWNAEKQRYELKTLARSFVAYVLKEPERSREASHALCTNCYEQGFKSILQSDGVLDVRAHAYVCPNCKGKFPCQTRDMDRLISALDERGG